jgi:hypothetical protein
VKLYPLEASHPSHSSQLRIGAGFRHAVQQRCDGQSAVEIQPSGLRTVHCDGFVTDTRTSLLGVVDTTGRPLFQPALAAPAGADALGTLLGKPVVLDQFAPNIAATNKALAFGDWRSYYTLRSVGAFEIARDPYTYLVSKGAVAFIGYGRGGSFLTDAGTHPVKVLTQHA